VTGSGAAEAPVGSQRSQRAIVGLGVGAMLVSFVVIPLFPFVVVSVLIWWLAEDLRRDPSRRPGWLGAAALGAFAVLAIATACIVTLFDAHFDCGGTLGGFGEASDARLDTECRDARLWRTALVGVVTTLMCVAGVVVVRRSRPSHSPLRVAAGVIVGVLVGVVGMLAVVTAI
jgi:hypothetical protein